MHSIQQLWVQDFRFSESFLEKELKQEVQQIQQMMPPTSTNANTSCVNVKETDNHVGPTTMYINRYPATITSITFILYIYTNNIYVLEPYPTATP